MVSLLYKSVLLPCIWCHHVKAAFCTDCTCIASWCSNFRSGQANESCVILITRLWGIHGPQTESCKYSEVWSLRSTSILLSQCATNIGLLTAHYSFMSTDSGTSCWRCTSNFKGHRVFLNSQDMAAWMFHYFAWLFSCLLGILAWLGRALVSGDLQHFLNYFFCKL